MCKTVIPAAVLKFLSKSRVCVDEICVSSLREGVSVRCHNACLAWAGLHLTCGHDGRGKNTPQYFGRWHLPRPAVIAVQSMTVLSDLDLSWMEPIRTVLNIVAVVIFKVDLLNLSCHVEDSNTTTHLACKLLIFPVMVLMMCVICTILKRILRIKWHSNNIMNSVGMLFMAFS